MKIAITLLSLQDTCINNINTHTHTYIYIYAATVSVFYLV